MIYAGTFSKILSPGLRLGWAVAPRPVLEKLNLGAQGATLCPSLFTQLFVSAYFETGHWERYMGELRELYSARRDTMLSALADHFPAEATWTRPQGGLFVWATLPDYLDTTDLLALALSHNVAFVPGRAAFLDGRGGSSLRLNFSGSSGRHPRGRSPDRRDRPRAGRALRHAHRPAGAPARRRTAPAPDPGLADVLALPRREPRRSGAPMSRR